MLRAGGNAVDAAVCAAAVLGVVEPYASGVGGDCFALIMPRGDPSRIVSYNGSGRAPAAADADALWGAGVCRIAADTATAVTVPGAVEAWARLTADHGSLPLSVLLKPAIAAAADGWTVTEKVAATWTRWQGRIGSPAPDPGEPVRNPELARTLQQIAADGAAGFYAGTVAEDIVDALQAAGGLHTLGDFAATRGEYAQPVKGSYRNATVWECPPNTQGVTALALMALVAAERPASDPLGPERHHRLAEAARIALSERDATLADPAVVAPRTDQWPAAPPVAGRDTTFVAAVDGDGTLTALISSIFDPFGSGIMAPRSGVLLNCRGAGFRLEPGHPNRLAPSRRPLHTIIPALAQLGDGRLIAFGVTGGDYQPAGQTYVLGNLLDYGMGLQEAIDLPRIQATAAGLLVEPGIPDTTRAGLSARGHAVRDAPEPIGSGQIAVLDPRSGKISGAADQRRDGCVVRA